MHETQGQGHILIVDDDPDFIRIAALLLETHGFTSTSVGDEAGALGAAGRSDIDLLLLDHQLGATDGLELLGPLRERLPEVPVVLVTAYSTVELAVQAIKQGAFDFLEKPIDEARLVTTVSKGVEHRRLLRRVHRLEEGAGSESGFDDMIGVSPPMRTIYRIIDNVAPTDANVMIVGESGTGKELVARAIHRHSSRARGPFVALNMGALPKDLVESTLFGHERGAFTGADKRRIGACEEATGGTLFLDEIREMPIETQPKLLRFLQERIFRRVGGDEVKADVRIVSATNRDPLEDVRQGRLREDLYFRLNVLPIVVPPLRDRRGDLALLATASLRTFAQRHGKSFDGIDAPALERLSSCRWPGNVRELIHTIERIVLLNDGPHVTLDMLPADLGSDSLMGSAREVPASPSSDAAATAALVASPPDTTPTVGPVLPMAEVERNAIVHAIDTCGSAAKAARLLGISEATIYRRLREYGIRSTDRGG